MARLHALLRSFVALECASVATAASAQPFTGLFVFGDSLSDRGNVAIAIGADPTQTITGNSYIPSKPYASNQFSNGDVWAKSFADALGLASFATPALAGGGDFAFGGARVATDGAGLPPSLSAQETQFLSSTGGSAPPRRPRRSPAGGRRPAHRRLGRAERRPRPGRDDARWRRERARDARRAGDDGALAVRLALESGVTVFDVYSLQKRDRRLPRRASICPTSPTRAARSAASAIPRHPCSGTEFI